MSPAPRTHPRNQHPTGHPEHAPPVPPPGHTREAVDLSTISLSEVLIAHNVATRQLLDAHSELLERLDALGTPAQPETVVLNPGNNGSYIYESREKWEKPVKSIGMLNPNSIPIYFSGVGSAAVNMRPYSAPPNSLIVLPISGTYIEVGANPTDLGANTAVCFLLRFFTVQQAFLGKGA